MALNTSPAAVDSIDWAAVRHAYGPATDIPELLSLLESEHKSDRDHAMYEFHGNVWHQGTRYPASVAIVPFLAALAANPAIYERDRIVHLLHDIALGYDHQFLPGGVDIESRRQEFERLRRLTIEDREREFHEWVAAALSEGERQDRMWERPHFENRCRELENELAVYDAVQDKALPTICDLLRQDDDAVVREAAARTVAFFPESSHKSLPLLRSMIFQNEGSGESIHEGLLATAIVSFILLLTTSLSSSPAATDDRTVVEQKLHHFLSHQSPILRWAAATGLSRLSIINPLVLATLASTVTTPPPEAVPNISFYFGRLEEYALESLEAACKVQPMPVSALKTSLTQLLDVLTSPNCYSYDTILSTCCTVLWPIPQDSPFNQNPPAKYEELASDEAKRLIKALAEFSPTRSEKLEGLEARKTWNLPADRDTCRRYVGLPEEGPTEE